MKANEKVQVKVLKRRIEQLLNGIFEYETPKLQISEDKIEAKVREGKQVRGSFSLENPAQKKVKGFLYAESPRVAFEPAAFSAISEKVIYEIDTTGMEKGDVLEGKLTVASSLGEYAIPYRIEIEAPEVKELEKPCESLEDFVTLAQKDFQKAYVFFASGSFGEFLKEKAPKLRLLYEGFQNEAMSYRSMEEFLVSAGLKEPVVIQADKTEASYDTMPQTIRESLTLTKSTWGFFKLEVTSDASFLKVEKPVVTTDEFIGSTYTLNYLIDREELHAGRNFGRIHIHGVGTDLTFEVRVHGGILRKKDGNLKEQHRELAALYDCYMDFRLKRIQAETWVERSIRAWDEYTKAGGTGTMMELIHIHLLFSAGKEEEACFLLDRIEQQRNHLTAPEQQGYFLYLTTFYNKDKKYIDYVEEKLGELSLRNPENWKLTWFLLYIRENYLRHPGQKLDAIRQQYIYGCASRIMYLEAALVLQKSPLLLKRLEDFEIRVLSFMVKEDLLNAELIMQIVELAGRYREYHPGLVDTLEKIYAKNPTKSLLRAIISLLLKGRRKDRECFVWYERGVEQDLRITGLYEYYIESMEDPIEKPLPQIIRMYFSYNNTLDYRKKAFVYANVIRNKDKDPKAYQSYRPAMEKFMVDELMLGHINDDLAFLYEIFITESLLNRRMAENLSRLLFTYRIQVEDPSIRYVLVYHEELKKEEKCPLKSGRANVQIYTENHRIFLEDENGNRYESSVPYTIKNMLTDIRFREYCLRLAPDSAGLLLNICSSEKPDRETVPKYAALLEMEEIRETYRKKLRQELLDFYCQNPGEESLYEFLHEINLTAFAKTDRYHLTELLISEGMSREAFSLAGIYGPEKVNLLSLVSLCHRMVLTMEYGEDEMLLALCHYCFVHEKYDEVILAYLLRYYDGPVERMKELWQAGKDFEADTFVLEEKILVMLMFTRSGAENTEEIFDSYRKALGRKMLLQAYVMYRAYDYLVKDQPVKEPVFRYIERGYIKGKNNEDVCLLALLRFYGELKEPGEKRRALSRELLQNFTNRGLRMAFFKNFPAEDQRACQLYDKIFVEYRANPGALVNIRYQITDGKDKGGRVITEPMTMVYEGIFVKEFTLFYGDHLKYQVIEEWNQKTKESEMLEKNYQDINLSRSSRYDLLNQMSKAFLEKNLEDAEFAVLQFKEQEALADHIFRLM